MKARTLLLTGVLGSTVLFLAGCPAASLYFVNLQDVSIADNNILNEAVSNIDVPSSFTVSDLNVNIDIEHTAVEDLDVWVESPEGTTVALTLTESGENFEGTIFDDEADDPIDDGSAPYTGRWQVDSNLIGQSLSDFDGEDAEGTWKLHVRDTNSGDVGFIEGWGLRFVAE